MKKILVFAMTSLIVLSSCKKATTSPNTNTNNTGTSTTTLPDEYISINDGTNNLTYKSMGGRFGNPLSEQKNKCYVTFLSTNTKDVFNKINMTIVFPSDSVQFANFQLTNYKVKIGSSDNNFGSNGGPLELGDLCINFSYSSNEPPFISDSENLNNSTYYNKVTSIKRISSKWSDLENIMTAVFMVEGEYKVHCMQQSTNKTLVVSGKYRFKTSSSL